MATFPGAQTLRWRLRGLLNLLPARVSTLALDSKGQHGNNNSPRIAYFFTGTFGDFVQVLRPLNCLATAFPGGEIVLIGGERYVSEFASELPLNLRTARSFELWNRFLHRWDLVFTNAVGVYRVRFDYAARFCAHNAFGFRHAHETKRGGYTATIALLPAVRSFAEENLRVLELAGLPALSSAVAARFAEPIAGTIKPKEPWGKGAILFHIGSAGLKSDFGLKPYTELVLGILRRLKGRPVVVIRGPGDEDIAHEVSTGTAHVPQMYPLARLIKQLRNFEGTVLCFNSFLAHLCHYLGRPAIVIHRQAVPYGYDCSPLLRQVVLKQEKDWDLAEVWEALELKIR